mmetsp:Transcript_13301/g.31662  ORF Transcript_13301/g.31662 Transcript_13301/m.31662 type:complete len:84 (+) Transcript_13301:311-562(+)
MIVQLSRLGTNFFTFPRRLNHSRYVIFNIARARETVRRAQTTSQDRVLWHLPSRPLPHLAVDVCFMSHSRVMSMLTEFLADME